MKKLYNVGFVVSAIVWFVSFVGGWRVPMYISLAFIWIFIWLINK